MKNTAIRGKFVPANKNKYSGNVNRITYRSLWERRFMLYCDRSNQVAQWSSEELHVPYISPKDNRYHNYYPDFVLIMNDSRRIMVEIKPEHQWQWDINKSKWESARQYCDENNMEFIVLGKKDLYGR